MYSDEDNDEEIKQAEKRLCDLKQKKIEEDCVVINEILQRWQDRVNAIPRSADKNYRLTFLPHPHSYRSPLQCMHYVELEDYITKKWRYQTYKNCDAGGKPLEIYGPTLESLAPSKHDRDMLAIYGVQWRIFNLGVDNSRTEMYKSLCSITSQLNSEIDALALDKPHIVYDYGNLDITYSYFHSKKQVFREVPTDQKSVSLLNKPSQVMDINGRMPRIKELASKAKELVDMFAMHK